MMAMDALPRASAASGFVMTNQPCLHRLGRPSERRMASASSLSGKSGVDETCQGFVACPVRAGHAKRHQPTPGRNQEHPMKKSILIALCRHFIVGLASAARAQDVAAGEASFKKCLACHSIGEGAKNKVGPVLNGLDGRHSGSAEAIPIPTPTRTPASPGARTSSSNTSRTRRPRSPAPRWPSPASRTRRKPTTSGPTSRSFDKDGKKK